MSLEGRIAVVLGTRPEIIKMAEIVHILGERAAVVHTGQHWDHAMSGVFMEHLGMPNPELSLTVGGKSRAEQIAQTLHGLDAAFEQHRPLAVLVQGDTNTVLGGALAANAHSIPLVHVEAGLRSFDRRMPEEHNRVMVDHLSDLCLAPTATSRQLLLDEAIPSDRIVVTGNPVVAAVTRALAEGAERARVLQRRLGLSPDRYVVATIHRPENTDDLARLRVVLSALGEVSQVLPVVLPLHPRTRARVDEFGLLEAHDRILVHEPMGYDEFVALCARSALTISDSGGVQEEASVWKRPVIVVRRSTERPEGLGTFAHLCQHGDDIVRMAKELIRDSARLWATLSTTTSPYGGLDAAANCVSATDRFLAERLSRERRID